MNPSCHWSCCAGLNGFLGADAFCTLLKETVINKLLRNISSFTVNSMIFRGNLMGEI